MEKLLYLQQTLTKLVNNGELYVPYDKWDADLELLVSRLDLDFEPDFGPGEVGYRPVIGYTIRPR